MMAEKQAFDITKYLRVARQCLVSSKYDEALAHFICLCNIQPSLKDEIQDEFMTALCKCVEILEHQQQYRKIVACFQEAAILFPNNETLLNNIGGTLFRLGFPDEAASFFRQALQLDPENLQGKQCLDNISNSLVERWHFRMLNDRGRNIAYQQAITKAIANGHDTVLDIGSGSGILSMFAVNAGATKVYACELSKTMFEVSQDILNANGMKDAIHLINKKSTDMVVGQDIPSKVSLVVTETMDCGLLGEGILKTITHAWQSLLLTSTDTNGPSNTVIPCAAKLYGMAISAPDVRNQCQPKLVISGINMNTVNIIGGDELDHECDHIDLVVDPIEPYTTESINQLHHGYLALSEQFVIAEYNLCDPASLSGEKKFNFDLPVIFGGSLDAIAVWFDLQLDEDISISTGPGDGSLCWEQAVFPVFPHHIKNPPLSTINNELFVVVNKGNTIVINGIIDQEFLKVQCSEILDTNVLKDGEMNQTDLCVNTGLHIPGELKCQETCPNCSRFSNEQPCLGSSQSDFLSNQISTNQCIKTEHASCAHLHVEKLSNTEALGAKTNKQDIPEFSRDGQYFIDITARKQPCQAVIPHAYMSRTNDSHYMNAYGTAIASTIEVISNHNVKCCWIIEHSIGLPLLSLITAKQNQNINMLVTNPVISTELLEQIRKDNDVVPNIHYGHTKLEDIAQEGRCWDVFVTDLIEPSGIIRHQGLEDIVFTRGCLLSDHGVTIPAAIQALSMCIESDTLMSLCKVQNNDNTLGLNIGSFMNQFKVSNQININMSTLNFKPLTEHFSLFTMDFMSEHGSDESLLALLEHTSEVRVKVLNGGVIHGLPYWFNLHLDKTSVISTYSSSYPGSHWKQAVYILDDELNVEKGDEIIVNVSVKQSCVSMKVRKV